MFSCAVFENNVYISGGTDTYDDSVDMYDVDKDVWLDTINGNAQ